MKMIIETEGIAHENKWYFITNSIVLHVKSYCIAKDNRTEAEKNNILEYLGFKLRLNLKSNKCIYFNTAFF